jgi:hypothetical protein
MKDPDLYDLCKASQDGRLKKAIKEVKMDRNEAIEIIEDIIISLRNHQRGLGDCKGVEFNRFMMRANALQYALRVLKGLPTSEDIENLLRKELEEEEYVGHYITNDIIKTAQAIHARIWKGD